MAYAGDRPYDGLPDYLPGIKNERATIIQSNLKNSGSIEMNVNGSVTPVVFSYTNDDSGYDHYITFLQLELVDSSQAYAKFGAITALTNGVDLEIHSDNSEIDFILSAKTNYDLLCKYPGTYFSDGTTVNEIQNCGLGVGGQDDALILSFDMRRMIPTGIRLAANDTSYDKIELYVKDDLTGLTRFRCYVYGYKVRDIQTS